MTWKVIGQSVAGASHTAVGKGCEDACYYTATSHNDTGEEILACCVSDGAGSAAYAARASALAVQCAGALAAAAAEGKELATEIFIVAEQLYQQFAAMAAELDADISEFSCTLLGCVIMDNSAAFFQIGDGAIVRDDGSGSLVPVWWPDNGEYQNTTCFLTDDPALGSLRITALEERITDVALLTDGLQLLALNTETRSAHQPFFRDMFRSLALVDSSEKTTILNSRLAAYLDSKTINDRTDDDKTLVLATRR